MATAVILSGGRGLRINGREKGLLSINGKSFIEHKIGLLSPHFDDILLVVNQPELYRSLDVRIVADDMPYSGVLGALLTALENCRKGYAFVTTSDTPFLMPEIAQYLMNAATGVTKGVRHGTAAADGVVAVWNRKIEPLCAVYSTRCAAFIRQVLDKKRIRAFYPLARIVFADEAEIRRIDPEGKSFININTSGDYGKYFTPRGIPNV